MKKNQRKFNRFTGFLRLYVRREIVFGKVNEEQASGGQLILLWRKNRMENLIRIEDAAGMLDVTSERLRELCMIKHLSIIEKDDGRWILKSDLEKLQSRCRGTETNTRDASSASYFTPLHK